MKKSGKLPFMQFFVADWLTDTALARCSFEAKGFWIDLLCFLWKSETRGQIVGSYEDIANLMGTDSDTVERHILRLKDTKTADVTIRDSVVTVVNRRMVKEEKARQVSRRSSSKYRQKTTSTTSDVNVTLDISEVRSHIAEIREIWNETLKETRVSNINMIRKNSSRERKLIVRIKEDHFRNNYKKAIEKILESDFLTGKSAVWKVTFDWFITNDNNYVKILEDNYQTLKNGRTTIKNEENYDDSKL